MSKRVLFAVLALGVLLIALGFLFYSTDYYHGDVYFQTEEQYTQFKQAILDSNAEIVPSSTFILSSEMPIVGKFGVYVDKGTEFPYGTLDKISGNARAVILGSFGISLLIVAPIGFWRR